MTRFYCKFLAESKDVRILKIGQHMPKLLANNFIQFVAVHTNINEYKTQLATSSSDKVPDNVRYVQQ